MRWSQQVNSLLTIPVLLDTATAGGSEQGSPTPHFIPSLANICLIELNNSHHVIMHVLDNVKYELV
jgi:hypothetical protein